MKISMARFGSRWLALIGTVVVVALGFQSISGREIAVLIPVGALEDVWTLIFALENPLGRFINQTILGLSALAVVELLLVVLRSVWNGLFITLTRHRIQAIDRSAITRSSLKGLLEGLNLDSWWQQSLLVTQRVRNLYRLRAKRVVDVGVLKEITGEREGMQGGFSRFIAGSLTVLGLVGTVLGLSLAVRDLAPLLSRIESVSDITVFSDQMLKTLAAMETAFSCTLAGLICAFVLSTLNYVVQWIQAHFYGRLEEFSNYELVPLLLPSDSNHATTEFVQTLETTGTTISALVGQVDGATGKFMDSATAVQGAANDMVQASQGLNGNTRLLGEAVKDLQRTSSGFVEAATTLTDQNARQVEQWSAVADQLRTTAGALKEQVEQLCGVAKAFQQGTDALQGIRDLPASLQQVLTEAMRGAVDAAQQRQNKLTDQYIECVEKVFSDLAHSQKEQGQFYADLLIGVQESVKKMLDGLQETVKRRLDGADQIAERTVVQ